MSNFPKWKILLVMLTILVAILFTIPNFISSEGRSTLPPIFPKQAMNLGLDLRGGSHLLIEVDFDDYYHDQLSMLADGLKKSMRDEKIGFLGMEIKEKQINFSLRIPEQAADAKKILHANRDIETQDKGDGKFSITYSEAFSRELKTKLLEQSIEIIRRRVDETGTKEPIIQRQGDNYIVLQVPGLDNPEGLKQILGKTAKLTFHMVNADKVLSGLPQTNLDPSEVSLPYDKSAGNPDSFITVKKKPLLTGDLLVDSRATFADGSPVVSFKFNSMGARIFGDITKENVGKIFAIVLDNKVISSPVIREPIMGGSGVISGHFTVETANELSLLLRAGALPAPLKIVEERTVGPSLGLDSIESGKKAGAIAMAFIITFMLATYLLFGLFAIIALAINTLFLVAAMSALQATLTMPGIAGIILTLGMAVDANVLIFERIREEIKLGYSVIASIDLGFKNAFRTIADSNITTLIVAFLLYEYGTGPIKGFAVTLSIGIIASMLSAITITKLMILYWYKLKKPTTINL